MQGNSAFTLSNHVNLPVFRISRKFMLTLVESTPNIPIARHASRVKSLITMFLDPF